MLPPDIPKPRPGENEYVHIRCLVANIHKPKNVCRPPDSPGSALDVVPESPYSSDTDISRAESDRSDGLEKADSFSRMSEDEPPPTRAKSNSYAGPMLVPPSLPAKRRRPSLLQLKIGGHGIHTGPLSAGPHLTVPRFTVTAPPGEQRRHSHGFPFHGFALRRHSNTVGE